MALAAATSLASFDQAGNREDLSDVLALMIASDLETTINLIGGVQGQATGVKHEWMEAKLSSWKDQCAEELATAETDLDVDDGTKFRIGTLFRIENEPEVMQVTNVAGNTLTIVRGYGSTSDPGVAYADDSIIEIISHPVQEDTDPLSWESIIRTRVYNYTQIFYKTVKVSDTQEVVSKAGVDSEIAWQVEQKLKEIKRELDINAIHGIRAADAGGDASYRSFGGLIEFVSAAGGNSLDASAAELTETRLINLMEDIYEDGGLDAPCAILCNSFQKRKISAFWKENRRMDQGGGTVGAVVDTFECDFGVVNVMLERHMPADAILIIDPKRVKLMPLPLSEMSTRELPKTGLALKREIVGQYTLEIRNATEAHGYYYNLAVA